MDEDVLPIFALDKAKTFSRVKPLYGSCFFHVSSVPAIPGFLPYRLSIVPRSPEFHERLEVDSNDGEDIESLFSVAPLTAAVAIDSFLIQDEPEGRD